MGRRLSDLVPLLGTLFDYVENLSTTLVMLRYPAQTAVVDLQILLISGFCVIRPPSTGVVTA